MTPGARAIQFRPYQNGTEDAAIKIAVEVINLRTFLSSDAGPFR